VAKVSLSLGCGRYDRTIPLEDGTVVPEGIDLNFIPLRPGELFRREARYADFDVAEFALSTTMILNVKGDQRFVALPIFPSRAFRHSNIYVNARSGLKQPHDLAGKRVGVQEYQQTAAVWIRGLLREEFDVDPGDLTWYQGAYDVPGTFRERVPVQLSSRVRREQIEPGKCLGDMLRDGEIDALIGAHPPRSYYEPDSPVVRLLPDFRAREAEYFERTRIFPIMHTVVVKRDVYERNPWIALSLFKAFWDAKEAGLERLRWLAALYVALPQLPAYLDESASLFGPDPFAYGFEENRHVLEKFGQLLVDDGLIAQGSLDLERVFAKECLSGIERG
jgi:4,5-dihydroxyphthalate decarboxylase